METTATTLQPVHKTVSLASIGKYPSTLQAYLNEDERLRPFYSEFPTNKLGWEKVIATKQFSAESRAALVQSLKEQYNNYPSSQVAKQIELLAQDNCYTVTTGHQIVINTGPLYFILKIASTIALAKQLKTWFPDKEFVPVYWMASEDHDRDEVNHFFLFGKKQEWLTDQTGAVGRFNTNGLSDLLANVNGVPQLFIEASQASTLAQAMQELVLGLFADFPLVVIDADSKGLKEVFKPIIANELNHQFAFSALEKTTQALEENGFPSQITGRAINLFYLKDNLRERIELEGDTYKVNRTELQFSKAEIMAELEQHPDRFSPNVVLRPLYQETILPNLAYLGGPAEVAYWFQLKGVFEAADVAFPMVLPRAFGMVVPVPQHQRMVEMGLTLEELSLTANELKELLLSREAMEPIDFSEAQAQLQQSFLFLQTQAELWDKTLVATVQAELAKAQKGAENLEKRISKAMESKFSNKANQALAVQQKLFPEGGLQERHSNILNFIMSDEQLIADITNSLNPLDFSFNIWYR